MGKRQGKATLQLPSKLHFLMKLCSLQRFLITEAKKKNQLLNEHLNFLGTSHPAEQTSGDEFILPVTPSQLRNNPNQMVLKT